MKAKLAFPIGVVAVLALIGVTIAEMQLEREAQSTPGSADSAPQASQEVALADDGESAGQDNKEADSPTGGGAPPGPRDTDVQRARGLYIRPDGTLVGRVNSIDRSTLTLLPVPNALVSFVQDRRVIGQAVTNTRGTFAIKGLTPWAVYSVVVASKDHVATLATVARPYDHDQSETEEAVGSRKGWVNEIRFVSFLPADEAAPDADDSTDGDTPADGDAPGDGVNEDGEAAEPPDNDYLDYEFHEFQMIPREDFIMALREGLYGFDVSSLPPPTSAGGAGAGGAGGGGAGDVVGPAVIGAAIGAGVGAAAGASESDSDRASPFRP